MVSINEVFMVKDERKLIFVLRRGGVLVRESEIFLICLFFFFMVPFWVEFKNFIVEKLPDSSVFIIEENIKWS